MKQRLTLLTVWIGFTLSAQTDFTHLDLEVRPDSVHSEIKGHVKLDFQVQAATDSVGINAVQMEFQQVKLNGKPLEYSYNDQVLWFDGTVLQNGANRLELEYRCKPRKGIYFVGWDDDSGISPRQVWTQGQGIDHRHWIPHKDDQTDKLTMDIKVHFDKAYEVISNGELLTQKEEEGGLSFWHYRMSKPMSSYLIALSIGKYEEANTRSNEGVPLTQYFYPEREEDYNWYYAHNEDIFNFMVDEVGMEFPWLNYKQVPVKNFRHGAMENTTATIFGDFFLVDEIAFNDRNYTYVNAHELAHQWFGNLVTATGSEHHWLHEGFATYYQWLSEQNLYGKDHFDWLRWEEAQLVFQASQIDTVPLGNGKAGSSRFYQKGAWVLHMLQSRFQKEDFKKIIQHYLKNNQFGVVNTDSLNASIKAVTRVDYSRFFEDWVFIAGEPILKVKAEVEDERIKLHYEPVWIPFERFWVGVTVFFEDGKSQSFRHSVTDNTEGIPLNPDGRKVKYWLVNPNMQQLAQVREEKSYPFWLAQYEKATSVIDRYHAVKGMAHTGKQKALKPLSNIITKTSEFHAVRAEALKQLAETMPARKFEALLLKALEDDDVQLQKKAILLVKDPNPKTLEVLHRLRAGRSYELRENALHLCIDPDDVESNRWLYDAIYTEEPGIPGHKVEITALLYRVFLFKDLEALKILKSRASPAYDFITRGNAMQALQNTGFIDEELCAYYFNALFDTNWKLRSVARSVLKGLYQEEKSKAVIDNYLQSEKEGFNDFQKRTVNATFDLKLD